MNKSTRREIKISGSQISEPIELTDLVIVQTLGKDYILREKNSNKRELWVHNDNFAGYCVRIGNRNFEFAHTL